MDEMRARMRDRRLERRARDARDAPPPPPDARGKDPPAGPSSNHDAVSVSESRAPRGFGAGTTARAESGRADASAPSSSRGDLARSSASLGRQDSRSGGWGGAERSGRFAPPGDDDDDDRAAARGDPRGLEAERETRRETEIAHVAPDSSLRARRLHLEREEAPRFERARRLELEGEVARLRESAAAGERALAEERRARALEAELRGELESVAARLAEACAAADEADRAARREMAEALDAARRDARRAAEAETDALRFRTRAEDAEATRDSLRERTRRLERRLEASAVERATVAGRGGDDVVEPGRDGGGNGDDDDEAAFLGTRSGKAPAEDGPLAEDAGAAASASALRAELVSLREDLARETSLAKSALREADEANRAREEAHVLIEVWRNRRGAARMNVM